ncbi:PH domain-containing protein [Mycoplasmatota bacterium]|nr:PH domain-containing protein [Mycoplasmatota bacterium]
MKKLAKNINLYHYVIRTLLSLIVYGVFILLLLLPVETFGESIIKTSVLIALSVIVFIVLVANFILPAFIYKCYGYSIKEDYVVFQKGVLFRRKDYIPIKRIQHIEKMHGPIQTLFNISSLIIYTAGSNDMLLGLPIDQADDIIHDIREQLQLYLDSDEVKEDDR